MAPLEIPPGTPCRNCAKREATQRWSASGGVLALTHGMWEPWCEVCVLEKQIAHVREVVEEADAKVTRLGQLYAAEGEDPSQATRLLHGT